MSATTVIRHTVSDYAAWRKVYDEVEPLRQSHSCTGQQVLTLPDNPNEVLALHDFPTVSDAQAFVSDPALKDAMGRAGVSGAPRIEIFESA